LRICDLLSKISVFNKSLIKTGLPFSIPLFLWATEARIADLDLRLYGQHWTHYPEISIRHTNVDSFQNCRVKFGTVLDVKLKKVCLGQGWRTSCMRKDFLGTPHSLLSQCFYLFCPTNVCIVKNVCVCVYIYIYIYIYIHILQIHICKYIYIYTYTYVHTHTIFRYIYTHTGTHIWLRRHCIWLTIFATKQYCERIVFTQIGSRANCCLYIYDWFAELAVTGRVCDIRWEVLQSSNQTKSISRPSYFQIFFLIAFLEEAIMRNMRIILCINYVIMTCIIDSNALINIRYVRLQDLTRIVQKVKVQSLKPCTTFLI